MPALPARLSCCPAMLRGSRDASDVHMLDVKENIVLPFSSTRAPARPHDVSLRPWRCSSSGPQRRRCCKPVSLWRFRQFERRRHHVRSFSPWRCSLFRPAASPELQARACRRDPTPFRSGYGGAPLADGSWLTCLEAPASDCLAAAASCCRADHVEKQWWNVLSLCRLWLCRHDAHAGFECSGLFQDQGLCKTTHTSTGPSPRLLCQSCNVGLSCARAISEGLCA